MSAKQIDPKVTAVGRRLVELCAAGKHREAMEELYADNIVSVEACAGPDMPAETRGKDGVRGKHDWWESNTITHGGTAKGPFVHGDRFMVLFGMDVTMKPTGQRMQAEEIGLYTVQDDKIVREEFFYVPPPAGA
ncbi:MAG: nuclear transport factor 2 family protein [Planctomycetes bacterium]|nr:nuclear transport factor 2 family protein [Planctomycetota bacterium]